MFIYLNWRCDHLPIYCLQNKTIREWQSVFPLWKFHWTSFELTQKCTFRMVGCRNSWFLWFYALLISFVLLSGLDFEKNVWTREYFCGFQSNKLYHFFTCGTNVLLPTCAFECQTYCLPDKINHFYKKKMH